jgi:hypothetical protein
MSVKSGECLFQRRFLLVRAIRFTLPFRETITMAARPLRARPVMAAKALSRSMIAAEKSQHKPERAVVADQDNRLRAFWEIGIPGRWWHRIGTRASANTSGPDFTSSFENPLGVLEPVKLRTAGIHTERRKPVFFCRTGFRASELFRKPDRFSSERALSK